MLFRIDLSILSIQLSHICIIYAEIFEKMSSGGLEVSFSIVSFRKARAPNISNFRCYVLAKENEEILSSYTRLFQRDVI